ncbi:MAG: methionyl-tRNA formyltransferase, partial [Lachnospiraceae bacterium]|nr:methionyl-tRNA formyltransferase [Lachnospiraceae bacterium]
MKIVYMGTPDFAVGALRALVEAGHQIAAVVTQPDKPKGRGKEMQMTPVKACALQYDIPVFQPVKVRMPEAVETLRGFGADVF